MEVETVSMRGSILNTISREREGTANLLIRVDIKEKHVLIEAGQAQVRMVHGTDDPFIPRSYMNGSPRTSFTWVHVRHYHYGGRYTLMPVASTFNNLLAEFECYL